MITQLSRNASILCNFLIPHWQSDLFAFTPAEFEQDKRPGELCLGSATSFGCDGCCSSQGRWWHVSFTTRWARQRHERNSADFCDRTIHTFHSFIHGVRSCLRCLELRTELSFSSAVLAHEFWLKIIKNISLTFNSRHSAKPALLARLSFLCDRKIMEEDFCFGVNHLVLFSC